MLSRVWLLWSPMDFSPPGSSVRGIFPDRSTGVRQHFSFTGWTHCRQTQAPVCPKNSKVQQAKTSEFGVEICLLIERALDQEMGDEGLSQIHLAGWPGCKVYKGKRGGSQDTWSACAPFWLLHGENYALQPTSSTFWFQPVEDLGLEFSRVMILHLHQGLSSCRTPSLPCMSFEEELELYCIAKLLFLDCFPFIFTFSHFSNW